MIARKRRYKKESNQEKALIGLLMLLDVLIIGFLVFGNLKLYAENRAISGEYLDLNKELEHLEGRNEELKELFSFASQEDYTEWLLREKGLYKKEGEEVVIISRDNVLESPAEQAPESKTASLWDKISVFFRSIFGRD
jgi:cell division protein FtsB